MSKLPQVPQHPRYEYNRAYRAANLERLKADQQRRYYADIEASRIAAREKGRRLRREHPEVYQAQQQRFRALHRERINAAQRERYKNDPAYRARIIASDKKRWEQKKIQVRLKRYGISRPEYEALFHKQEGKCAVCKLRFLSLFDKGVQVDHCHATQKVRGLLCVKCNLLVGWVETGKLAAAEAYLEYH